jgi:hypothetical protein
MPTGTHSGKKKWNVMPAKTLKRKKKCHFRKIPYEKAAIFRRGARESAMAW